MNLVFYEPVKNNHGLQKNPFNSLVIPRPIGWISSVDLNGEANLAPFSFFNAVCYRTSTVMFSSGSRKSPNGIKVTLRNIEATGEFVCNLSTWETREAMNMNSESVPSEIDELEIVGLTKLPSNLIDVTSVAEAPVYLECRYVKSVEIPYWENQDRYVLVLVEVVGVHIRDEIITQESLVDVARLQPLGRLGNNDYTVVRSSSIFTMKRPK